MALKTSQASTKGIHKSGGNGSDFLLGRAGDDFLFGSDGKDWIDGGAGNDVLDGGFGNDHVFGGKGNDTLIGSGGDDYLNGGAGNDVFRPDWGKNTIVSERNDADTVELGTYLHGGGTLVGNTVMFGFNGAGKEGGDVLNFHFGTAEHYNLDVTEIGGKTHFRFEFGNDAWHEPELVETITVDAVGLAANVDYFLL